MGLFDENQIHCGADMAVLLVDCYGILEHCLHESLWCSYRHSLSDVIRNMTSDVMACFGCRHCSHMGNMSEPITTEISQSYSFQESRNDLLSWLIILYFFVPGMASILLCAVKIFQTIGCLWRMFWTNNVSYYFSQDEFCMTFLCCNHPEIPGNYIYLGTLSMLMGLLIIHKGIAICGKIILLWWGEESNCVERYHQV